MEDKTYNGWTNYETWLVKLWMDNDQGSQDFWDSEARDAMQNVVEKDVAGAEDLRQEAASDLAERMKNSHEEYADEILPGPASFLHDLVNSALADVNWDEIARAYVDDIPVYVAGVNMPGYLPDSDPALFLDFEGARDSLKEILEQHAEPDDAASEDEIAEILDEIDDWKEAGEHGFNFGARFYWIVRH